MPAPLIQNVADTAFMIAAHRAIETKRRDALFRDPLAERLAGAHGRNVTASIPEMSAMTGWSVAIRTRIIDEFILQMLREGVDAVLNLGAGLDTRPYRMALPASLQWIEVDYPNVIELKQERLAAEQPACKLRRIGLDLTDRGARQALFAGIEAGASNVLVLTEGVVPYLTAEDAGTLADDLRGCACFRQWIVDYFSPAMMKYYDRTAVKRGMQHAPWRFRPRDYDAFFATHGWTRRETRYLAIEAERLRRPAPLPRLLRWSIRFAWLFAPQEKRDALKKTAGYVLLRPAPDACPAGG